MSDLTPTTPPPAAPSPAPTGAPTAASPPPFWQKATRWLIAACLLLAGGLGIVKAYNNFFSLPGCA